MSDKFRMPWHAVHFQATADELGQRLPYNILNYKIQELWEKVDYGAGIKIGVADTGISSFHKTKGDLAGAVYAERDFTRSSSGTEDMAGHGTHCAGTIGARNNKIGIAGVLPDCKLAIAKVLGDDGMGDNSWVAAGVRYLVDQGVDIISMSLGSPSPSNALFSAIEYAIKHNVLIVCAAGNDGEDNAVNYPGKYSNTLTVGAVDRSLNLADFSSRGPEVDICGPGVQILSCYKGSTYSSISGTSMATPWLAAGSGLMLATTRKYGIGYDIQSVESCRSLYSKTAKDLGRPGKDTSFGFGVLNVNQTFETLMAMDKEPVTTPEPTTTPPAGGDISTDACGAVLDILERWVQAG